MIRPAQVASKTIATTLLLPEFSPLQLVFRHKILDRKALFTAATMEGNSKRTPSPIVL